MHQHRKEQQQRLASGWCSRVSTEHVTEAGQTASHATSATACGSVFECCDYISSFKLVVVWQTIRHTNPAWDAHKAKIMRCLVCPLLCCLPELATSQLQKEQLQRELSQLRAMLAEKDERLADAAGGERQLRQQLEQLRQQLQEAGQAVWAGGTGRGGEGQQQQRQQPPPRWQTSGMEPSGGCVQACQRSFKIRNG